MLAVALAHLAFCLAFTFDHVGDWAFAAFPGEVGIYGIPLPILETVIRHCYKGTWAGKCCGQPSQPRIPDPRP